MSWVEIQLPAIELNIQNGVVKWNSALQLMMSDPKWVELMWDAVANTLGIRATYAATGIPVVEEPEGSEYKIDSQAALSAAGITTGSASGSPSSWRQETASGSGDPKWFNYNPIYYLTLPW